MSKYIDICKDILLKIISEEGGNIEKASAFMVDTLKNDGLIHVTGGHCQFYPMEMFYRAGGLVPINPILPHLFATGPRTQFASDIVYENAGVGKVIFEREKTEAKDCLVAVSIAGRTLPTIEIALAAKEKGLKVIVIQSLDFSSQTQPKHPDGIFLSDIADVVINMHVPYGDAVLDIHGVSEKCCPSSSVVGFSIVQALVTQTVCTMAEEGVIPPVWVSSNLDRGDIINKEYITAMKGRVSCL